MSERNYPLQISIVQFLKVGQIGIMRRQFIIGPWRQIEITSTDRNSQHIVADTFSVGKIGSEI